MPNLFNYLSRRETVLSRKTRFRRNGGKSNSYKNMHPSHHMSERIHPPICCNSFASPGLVVSGMCSLYRLRLCRWNSTVARPWVAHNALLQKKIGTWPSCIGPPKISSLAGLVVPATGCFGALVPGHPVSGALVHCCRKVLAPRDPVPRQPFGDAHVH